MSFFTEIPTGANETIVLFSTHRDNEPFKRYLSEMGGTFCRELKTQQGNIHPAWVFDLSKKLQVEAFITENEDTESVSSLPDFNEMMDEILRRIENNENAIKELFELVAAKRR